MVVVDLFGPLRGSDLIVVLLSLVCILSAHDANVQLMRHSSTLKLNARMNLEASAINAKFCETIISQTGMYLSGSAAKDEWIWRTGDTSQYWHDIQLSD